MKILIVDDSNFARRSLKNLLLQQLEGWEIVDTGISRDAIGLFQEHKPSLVFLDLTMPEISGDEVLKQIRDVDKDCKVIVVTADIQNKTKQTVMDLGADAFINKPIDAEKLAGVLVEVF